MIKMGSILKEGWFNLNPDPEITIDDIEELLTDKYINWEVKTTLNVISEFYHGDDPQKRKDAIDYIELLNKTSQHAIEIAKKLNVPYVEIKDIKRYLLSVTEFRTKVEEFFPMNLYISSSPEDEAIVGVEVDYDGKVIGMGEGNDEATPETISIVNRLINPLGKPVRIYAAHNAKLAAQIEETGILPPNLYVSPHRPHAASYVMDLERGERMLFTGIININSVSQESELDWKTIGNTKIEKFRLL